MASIIWDSCSKMSYIPSINQMDALLTFLEEHPELARGQLRNVEGRSKSKELWTKLTQELNTLSGCSKTTKQWQKVWADKKYLTKKAAAAARQASLEGGPSTAEQLSAQELRIVALMEEAYAEPETAQAQSTPAQAPSTPAQGGSPVFVEDYKVEVLSHASSPDMDSVSDEPSSHRDETPAPGGSLSGPRPARRTRRLDTTRQTMRRLLELEERRVTIEAQRTVELGLIRESIQQLCGIIQANMEELLVEMRARRS